MSNNKYEGRNTLERVRLHELNIYDVVLVTMRKRTTLVGSSRSCILWPGQQFLAIVSKKNERHEAWDSPPSLKCLCLLPDGPVEMSIGLGNKIQKMRLKLQVSLIDDSGCHTLALPGDNLCH